MIKFVTFILNIPVYLIKVTFGIIATLIVGIFVALFVGPDDTQKNIESIWAWVNNGYGLFGGID